MALHLPFLFFIFGLCVLRSVRSSSNIWQIWPWPCYSLIAANLWCMYSFYLPNSPCFVQKRAQPLCVADMGHCGGADSQPHATATPHSATLTHADVSPVRDPTSTPASTSPPNITTTTPQQHHKHQQCCPGIPKNMGALLSLPFLALPGLYSVGSFALSCCGAAACSALCSACGKCNSRYVVLPNPLRSLRC